MTVFYNMATSPNALKVKIFLNEANIDHQQMEMTREELSQPEYLSKSPTGLIPAIDDEGVVISESGAILSYLAEKHTALLPTDLKEKALVFQAQNVESSFQAPTLGGQGIFGEMAKPEEERDMARVGKLMPVAQRLATVLSELLGDRPYFAGDFSIADIQLFPGLTKAIEHQVFQNPAPNLIEWNNRMKARPAVKEACQQYMGYQEEQ